MIPNTRRQLRVLHREFLFRIVDRELLSSHARGDMSKLLLQIVSLLIFISLLFTLPAVLVKPPAAPDARLLFAWNYVHTLIAITMAVVGLFGVLSWNSMFPDRLDVFVLAPLPVRTRVVFAAKVTAVSTALGVTVLALHLAAGLIWPLWLNSFTSGLPIPGSTTGAVAAGDGAVVGVVRLLIAYWLAMIAAGLFVFGVITSIQGCVSSLLPRRHFLRVSGLLQLAAFVFIVIVVCVQPMRMTPAMLATLQDPSRQAVLAGLPSLWFFGLFHQLSGSTALAPLAARAWAAMGVVMLTTTMAYALSYTRTLRRIAEEPAIAPGGRLVSWLPRFGKALQTAIVHFSIRSLLRSPQHRVILAFYLGIGGAFGIALIGMRIVWSGRTTATAPALDRLALMLIFSNIMLLIFAVLGTRVAFALPIDLRANWIFRVTPVPGGPACLAARRRALLALSVGPVWIVSAGLSLWVWPWQAALGQLVVLALLGLILAEIALFGAQKIPFTCSYLPGKSNVHASFWVGMMFLSIALKLFSDYERRALERLDVYAMLVGALVLALIVIRWWMGTLVSSADAPPEFEELEARPVALDVWDSRLAR